jgi:hypothetical protein
MSGAEVFYVVSLLLLLLVISGSMVLSNGNYDNSIVQFAYLLLFALLMSAFFSKRFVD